MALRLEPPIFHIHVRIVRKRKMWNGRQFDWFALMEEPNGEANWVQQPAEPKISEEQLLYVVRSKTPENKEFDALVARGASADEIERWLFALAKKHGVYCEKTWQEAKALLPGNN